MASLYRPTVIRYVLPSGRQVAKGTPGAKRRREKSRTWRGRYLDADGNVCTKTLCNEQEAAQRMLADIVTRAKREARGEIDPFEDHRKRPLREHLADFTAALHAKGATSKQAVQATTRCLKIIDGCRFIRLVDLVPSAIASYLRERRQAGLSIATSNGYLSAIKSFGNWLVKDGRIASNPLAHLTKLNDRVDIRRERRALTADELTRLAEAAERSGESFRGLNGPTRAMLYRTAVMTGLRASELASLTPASFDLTSDPSTVTVDAACSKRRREDVLPLHPDLAARLRQWLLERGERADDRRAVLSLTDVSDAKRERLFPGTWVIRAWQMMRLDLDVANVPYSTDAGVADFHSLRHTFVSNLAAAGVHPKLAQQLARHSTITLTMDRYSHLSLLDVAGALESLPCFATPESQPMRATGTADNAPGLSCTKSCTHPAQIDRSQPSSTIREKLKNSTATKTKKPHFPRENEGVCDSLTTVETQERVKGIEPSYAAWEAAALPLSYTRERPRGTSYPDAGEWSSQPTHPARNEFPPRDYDFCGSAAE